MASTDADRLSTQNPIELLVLPAPICSEKFALTVNRVPERLKLPFHEPLSFFTVVGRSNPTVNFLTVDFVLLVINIEPHQPFDHLSSYRNDADKPLTGCDGVGVGVAVGVGVTDGVGVGVGVEVRVGVGVGVTVGVGVGVGVGVTDGVGVGVADWVGVGVAEPLAVGSQ